MIRFVLAVAPGILLALYLTSIHTNYQLDDALIYARYVRNALELKGLVFNEHEYWNSLSSPLYAACLTFVAYVFGDVLFAQHFLSALTLCCSIVAGATFLRKVRGSLLSVYCFSLLIASSQYFYTIFGMESFLFGALLFFSLSLYQELAMHKETLPLSQSTALAISLTLLILTRGEGIFLVALLASYHLYTKRPLPRAQLWLIPLVGAALLLTAHFYLYGSLIPKTFSAKMAQGTSGFWGGHLAFLKGVKMYTWYFGRSFSTPFTICFLLTVSAYYIYRRTVSLLMFVGYLGLIALFYTALKIPFYHWYYAPALYYGYFLLALSPQISRFFSNSPAARQYTVKVLIGGFLMTVIYWQYSTTRGFVQSSYRSPYRTIAEWIEKNTSEDASIASVEVGALGWYAKRPIIDILGLTSPRNAEFLARKELQEWTKHYSPSYMVIHEPLWPQEVAANRYLKKGAKKITKGMPKGFALIEIQRAQVLKQKEE